jgi:hypothetical protein
MSRCFAVVAGFASLLLIVGTNAVPMNLAARISPITTLNVGPAFVPLVTAISLNAYASSGRAVITAGRITFVDGNSVLTSVQMVSNGANGGHTSYQSRPGATSHSISGVSGQTNSYASSSTVARTVTVTGKAPSTMIIGSSRASTSYTLTETVTMGGSGFVRAMFRSKIRAMLKMSQFHT